MYDSNPKLRAWRTALRLATEAAMVAQDWQPLEDVPIRVGLTFTLPTPQTVAATIKRQPGRHPAWRGYDLDKLARAALDSLTDAQAWDDDSRVTTLIARKLWAGSTGAMTQPGLYLEVREDKT
jgi:Holliday junction resolvase RusA-like endonuclease